MSFGLTRSRRGSVKLVLLFAACLGFLPVRFAAGEDLWYRDLCSYTWEAMDQDEKLKYTLSLCPTSEPTSCGTNAAVCAQNLSGTTAQSVGDRSLQRLSGSVLDFNSTLECPNSGSNIRTSISFQCGTTLGSPEFVAFSQCVHYFEWKTYTACKKDKFKPHKEVPCYIFDSDGRKHDLSPLIKLKDGYLVDDGDDGIDFYINVCRSIYSTDKSCPEGSAACLVTGEGSFSMGLPAGQLEHVKKDSLRLQYALGEGSTPPSRCGEHAPAVTITFICPSRGRVGSPPKMTANQNCRYEVEWVTEYACHRDYLESHSCRLTSKQHNVSIDLTPLTITSKEQQYHAHSGTSGGPDSYIFYLNICGKVVTKECGDDPFVSSCQVKTSSSMSKVAGRFQNQTLRYSDGDLTLIYPGGTSCSSGFQRMTIINFQCNKNATDSGKGSPVFAGETDCTYYFNWETAFACVREEEDLLCRVTDGRKHYDLSPLTRYPESDSSENWEVEDAKSTKSSSHYFLNVCHKVIRAGGAAACPEDASICAVDKNNQSISLGSFLSPPYKTRTGDDLRLVYTDGSPCPDQKRKIQSILTLRCKPGGVESPPVLVSVSSDECFYELEWLTAAACVLSKTQGDSCRVGDPQAGFSFDLSPLSKPDGGFYNLTDGTYTYLINVCGPVKAYSCPDGAGACQVEKSSWSLGEASSRLSYYDGLIQLTYRNGSQYNNKEHTRRSTLISFLCDPEAGLGKPDFQVEDNYTYNFHWYTSLACPERSHQCLVTDPKTLDQYDLSSLSRSTRNWQAMDLSDPRSRKSYYINICRAIVPVVGCDREASVCEMTYVTQQGSPKEVVSVSNMGVSKKGPVIEGRDRLLLEFTDGSACTSEGLKLSYTTRIHLICSRGTLSMPPRFESNQNCTSTFIWETQAACAIRTTQNKNQTCSVVDPNTGYEYNLQLLASKTGYNASANGKDFLLNICSDAPGCGEGMAGCELDSGKPVSPVGVTKTLQYSTDGKLKLTYRGPLVESTGTRDTFTINFVCDPNPHPNPLELLREEMSTIGGRTTHDAVFSFYTALACTPAPVDCSISDALGNEYDLSRLIRDEEDSPWIPMDTEAGAGRRFYINVCKPLPALTDCPVGPLGACGLIDGRSVNLGYVQSMPQMAEDGSISIVYQNGDQCGAASRYSTRIIFQCDDSPGSPMLDRRDGCEFVFVWRTSEACPIRRSKGENCQVQDPRSGFQFDLGSLKGRNVTIRTQKYVYHLSVCGPLPKNVCSHGASVSSCQVNGDSQKIAGLANQNLVFVGDQILLNYTNGETCHKIYQRSTLISFSCHPDAGPGEPEFIKETPDCSYLFTWPTALACAKTISCSYNDGQGRSYDLSPLALDSGNWEVEVPTQGTERRFFINVCRSLVQQAGPWKCPSGAASCMRDGDKFLSLGRVESAPKLDGSVLKLQYTSGQPCPDGRRNRTSIIRFKCDKDRVDSRPTLISQIQDCVFTFLWLTAAACPLNTTQHGDCRVTNPSTGHLFDLSPLKKKGGYTMFDPQPSKRVIHMNVCGGVDYTACPSGSAVCFLDAGNSVSGGQVSQKLSFRDGEVELTYDEGSRCAANPELKHKSVIHFICRPAQMSTAPPEPVLISSDPQTCTHFFSFYSHLVCEKQVTCSVQSGSTLIDLTPLIHVSGFYLAEDEAVGQSANSPDFYINICQPLNSIPGVACPPGAAACMDPADGPPVDIGRTTKGPEVNKDTSEVSITYSSSTPCTYDPAQNYTSTIIFSCQRGTDLGSPLMLRQQGCVFLFEWETPLVCPDATNSTGCQLTDAQLQFTFDLQSLSEDVAVTTGSGTYHLHVCGTVTEPLCKQSAVCLVSGSGSNRSATSFGISKAMSLDYKHEEQALLLQYGGGDQCPAVSAKRQTSIFFKCDRSAGHGSPQLLAETKGCSSDFQWNTSVVCPPIKMECKLVSKHQTFDLRSLSSLTKPWRFKDQRYSYFINLCQGIHGGMTGCPEDASVCRRSAGGLNQTLGRVYTQKMSFDDGQISIRYTAGDEVCGNQVKASALIRLACGSTVGRPSLVSVDTASCQFVFHWETRSACAVKQQEVKMVNGTIRVPDTGASLSLGAVYFSYHQASGDIRPNGDRYIYHIQLSGITNSSLYSCEGANICQDKLNATYRRRIGNSTEAQYYVKGGNLDVIIPSNSKCGRIEAKKVSSTIMFQCSPSAGVGIPEFMLETDECQYLFVWHTDAVCGLIAVERETDDGGGTSPALSQRSQAVGGVLGLLLLGLTVCLLGLLLYKRERRELVMQKVSSCCRRGNQLSYKYSKVNTDEEGGEEEMEWLMEEVEAPDSSASSHHRSNHSNGHVRTKRVNTDALRPFSMDEQEDDSEDEVLSIPGVRVHKPSRSSAPQRSAFLQEESDEDLVGLLEDSDGKSKGRKPPPSGLALGKSRHKADEEDSDEDLLRV